MEDIIREFLVSSIRNNFEEFDWQEAFEEFLPLLQRNLAENGIGSLDEYIESFDGIYGLDFMADEVRKMGWAAIEDNSFLYVSANEIVDTILKKQWEERREQFSGAYSELIELKEDIESHLNDDNYLDLPAKIQLFDRCIHAEHQTGNIIEDVDIDRLKREIDEQESCRVTNMRYFL